MTHWSKQLPYKYLIPAALLLGLAPFYPQPHLIEKIGMLFEGTLYEPIDIFDLFWHSWAIALLAVKVIVDWRQRV
jgi:hypothetical protein